MVHLRTVPDAWHAKVLVARLGCEGILTQLRGNLSGPYPFGAVSVLVEEDQAQLAADLLLADEVEAAFSRPGPGPRSRAPALWPASAGDLDGADDLGGLEDLEGAENCADALAAIDLTDEEGPELENEEPSVKVRPRWRRAVAAAAAIVVAGAPLLAHFVSS